MRDDIHTQVSTLNVNMTFISGRGGGGVGVEGVVDLNARIVATWYTFWFECETTLSYVELCN